MTFTNLTDALVWLREDERRRIKIRSLSGSIGFDAAVLSHFNTFDEPRQIAFCWDDLLTAREFIGIEPGMDRLVRCVNCERVFPLEFGAPHKCSPEKSELDRVIEANMLPDYCFNNERAESIKAIAHAIVNEAVRRVKEG